MKHLTCKLSILLAVLVASSHGTRAEVRFLAHGHTDLAIDYDAGAGAWDFHVGSDTLGVEFAPDEVVLKAKAAALTNVPPNASFLGPAGSPVWILPQVQNEEVLYLGYGGDGIPDGVFVRNQVRVTLKSVTGPGNFFAYTLDSFLNPVVSFNSADGISTNDVATVQGGGDTHLNWAFTQPGEYTVVLEASGTLAVGNAVTSSGPVTFRFSVGDGPKMLDTGHTDLAIDYSPDENAWDVHVGSDALEETYDADDVILRVKGEAKTTIPSDPKYAFQGTAGDPIWILPQAQNEEILYLGYGGDGIPDGVFVGNQVKVALKSVTGLDGAPAPGDFFSYSVDPITLGPVVLFNSRDSISTNDVAVVQSGGDAHLNWAFSQPGEYQVTVEVTGTLVDGNEVVSSGPVTYTFSELKPIVPLTVEHTDIQGVFDATATNKLTMVAFDVNHTVAYQSDEVALVVAEAAKTPLPSGTPFGPEGAPLWILPASQNPALLYLGLSAEPPSAAGRPGILSGVFNGNLVFQLKSVDGPGSFFLWQSGGGGFDVQMDTADGITDADAHMQIIGSHEHFNWGFTTNGVYRVTFQLSGLLAGSTNISSPDTTFTFNVLPLATNAPPASIQLSDAKAAAVGGFAFDVIGAANMTVEVQGSEDLKQWSLVMSSAITTSPQTITIPADVTKTRHFFRVQTH
ncbi:MAG: choice-of-anchor M domain-containing protein [Verrucomicrobiota bacterium]